jgi:hypothetical protein
MRDFLIDAGYVHLGRTWEFITSGTLDYLKVQHSFGVGEN